MPVTIKIMPPLVGSMFGLALSTSCIGQIAFPIVSPDSTTVELVKNIARLDTKHALKNDAGSCKTITAVPIPDQNWVTQYLDCRTVTIPSSRSTILISEEREIPNSFDTFRAIDLVIELPENLKAGRLELPNRRVRIFFTNCRHSWVHLAGCFVGVSAYGYIKYEAHDAVSGIVEIDLRLQSNEYLLDGVIDHLAVRQNSFRLTKRVAIGKDPTK